MLKPYPKYKDSGVEWIGQVPEDWAIKPIKRLFRIVNGATPTSTVSEYWDGNIPWVTPDDLGSNSSMIINDTRRHITEQGYNSCGTTLIPEGSLVMSTRAPIGYLAIVGKSMCSNQGCKSFVALNNIENKYYYYFLSASKDYIDIFGKGSTFKELSRDDLAAIPAIEPTKNETEQIAKFLDDRTSKINDLIAKKERMIELLKEQRAAEINEAVTKGLDPNVKMKDSGVEWIGKVPEHWEVKKLKFNANVKFSNVNKKTEEGEENVRLCNYVDVYYNDYITEDLEYMEATASKEEIKKFLLEIGDVLLTKDSEEWNDIAIPAYVKEVLPNLICGYHLAQIRTRGNLAMVSVKQG
jgi:type I restriction enzyme S subunit